MVQRPAIKDTPTSLTVSWEIITRRSNIKHWILPTITSLYSRHQQARLTRTRANTISFWVPTLTSLCPCSVPRSQWTSKNSNLTFSFKNTLSSFKKCKNYHRSQCFCLSLQYTALQALSVIQSHLGWMSWTALISISNKQIFHNGNLKALTCQFLLPRLHRARVFRSRMSLTQKTWLRRNIQRQWTTLFIRIKRVMESLLRKYTWDLLSRHLWKIGSCSYTNRIWVIRIYKTLWPSK